MLRLFIINTIKTPQLITRSSSTSTSQEKWDLLAAVCLERRPTLMPAMSDIEKQFSNQLAAIELERSCKSKHEVQHENDLKQLELLKKGDGDVDASLKQMAQDFVDASVEELKRFKFAKANKELDKDVKSIRRKLDKHLVLLTQQQLGDKKHFLLPQGIRQDGETLRQTAERVLKEQVGNEMHSQIYGNAPTGFYKYKYPKSKRNETNVVGAKVFIYFGRYNKGLVTDKCNHKWLDRMELKKELPEQYHSSVQQFLIDE